MRVRSLGVALGLGGLGVLGPAAGCERVLGIQDPVAVNIFVDAASDARPLPPGASPLLLSEIALAPNAGQMIEIVNTSSSTVDLATYYLSDSGSYFTLPGGAAQLDATDFIIKFPDGATIAGHTAITVAIAGAAAFTAIYGVAPTYSVQDGTMLPLPPTDTTMAGLTNTGEPMILFQWDLHSNLVRDVDLMIVGNPSQANALADKSGVVVIGPDPTGQIGQYARDARTIRSQASAPGSKLSTKRILLEDGHETWNGAGNGLGGEDETSEDTSLTWDQTFTTATPNLVPPALFR